jgi:hypothetical protein
MTVQRARSHHATSQNPQDSRIDRGMIQDGKLRGFAMGHAIPVRTERRSSSSRAMVARSRSVSGLAGITAEVGACMYRKPHPVCLRNRIA